jgi:hypothetical protein
MKAEQLIDKLLAHLVTQVAPKLTDPLKKFKIGLLGGGIGRRRIVEMAKPLLDDVTGPDGEIDLAALRQAVNAGFDVAHKVPVAELGIEIDANDAARFFDGL